MANSKPARGVNLQANTEYSTDGAWHNARMVFLPWGKIDRPWEPNPDLKTTATGYPLSDAATFSYMRGYSAGRFEFRMMGSGVVTFGGRLRVAPTADVPVPSTAGEITGWVDFDPAKGENATITIRNIDPNDPPRNLQLLTPDAGASNIFTKPFLAMLRECGTTVRFMDWGRTNHHKLTFAQRVKPDDWNQVSENGVAIEYMIVCCNESGLNGWYNVPHTYTVEDIRAAAMLWFGLLIMERVLFVEWSNECWNNGFRQHAEIVAQANSQGGFYPGIGLDKAWQHIANMAVICGDIFRQQFGRFQYAIRNILAGQASNPYVMKTGLDFLAKRYGDNGDLSARLYGVSVARYFSSPEDSEWDKTANAGAGGVRHPEWTPEQWATEFVSGMFKDASSDRPKYAEYRNTILAAHPELVSVNYEGGGSLAVENTLAKAQTGGATKKLNGAAKFIANRAPDQRIIYIAAMASAAEHTQSRLFMQFNACFPPGDFFWGLREHVLQPTAEAPKLLGFLEGTVTGELPAPQWSGKPVDTIPKVAGQAAEPPAVVQPAPPVVTPLPPKVEVTKVQIFVRITFSDGTTQDVFGE